MISEFDMVTVGIGPSRPRTVGSMRAGSAKRNANAAVKAIHVSRLVLLADGQHYVSLDNVIRTVREVDRDMEARYKETARDGLAVNVVEC